MAITDISISEELMTNAPSIKYRGDEGPKSPQEMQMMMSSYDYNDAMGEAFEEFLRLKKIKEIPMDMEFDEYLDQLDIDIPYSKKQKNKEGIMMVDDVLDEAYEQYIYDLLEQRPDATPMSKEEFRRMVIMEGMMGGGNPLPEDPTKPVNPFAPKPTGPTLPNKREMAAYGGIMGLDGRKQYGIGSFFQEKILDPIKKNPVVAATLAALGSNYFDVIPGEKTSKGYLDFIIDPITNVITKERGKGDNTYTIGEKITEGIAQNIVPALGGIAAGLFTKNTESDTPGLPSDNTALQLADLKKAANLATQAQGLAAGLNFLPTVAARKFTPEEMAVTYAKSAANGGRIGRAEGGLMDLGGLEKDYRNTGGFVEIGAKEKADDVPARLSVNEFVFTADAVRNAGGGDIDEGAKVMENVMKHLEGGGRLSRESQGMGGARDMFAVSERLSEVV